MIMRPDSGTVNAKHTQKRNSTELNANKLDGNLVEAKEITNSGGLGLKVFVSVMILSMTFLAGFDAYYLY